MSFKCMHAWKEAPLEFSAGKEGGCNQNAAYSFFYPLIKGLKFLKTKDKLLCVVSEPLEMPESRLCL